MREQAQGTAITRVRLEGELPVSSISHEYDYQLSGVSYGIPEPLGGFRAMGGLQGSSRALFTAEPSGSCKKNSVSSVVHDVPNDRGAPHPGLYLLQGHLSLRFIPILISIADLRPIIPVQS